MASPHASDDEGGDAGDLADAVAGLLGLSNNFTPHTAKDAEYEEFFTNGCEEEM